MGLKYQKEGSVVVDGGEGDRFSTLIDHRDPRYLWCTGDTQGQATSDLRQWAIDPDIQALFPFLLSQNFVLDRPDQKDANEDTSPTQ